MKKKLITIEVVVAFLLSMLVGCGSTDTVDNAQETEAQQTQKLEESHEHSYTETVTKEATCTESGEKILTCSCGDTYTEPIEATGHQYVEYVSNNDATYLADGTETATCVCGLTDTRTAEGSKLEYTYTDLDKTMYAKQSVNVRDLPTADGNKLGGLSFAQGVKVTGQCNETSWYRIEFESGVAYVSNSYLQDEKPVQQTTQENQSSGEPSGNTYILDGMELEYGVMYLNVCGHNLTGERVLSRSQGPFPYPLGQLIDNGDGTYTVYMIQSHGYFLDGNFYIHDISRTAYLESNLKAQGYTVEYVGGDDWTSCVGGYDEGCIHKWLVY